MTGPGFAAIPPDIDYADPETDSLCHYCGSVETDEGDCVVCAPRCLLIDTPVRFSATLDDGLIRFEAVEMYTFATGGTGLALVTWEGGKPFAERRCVGVRELWGAAVSP